MTREEALKRLTAVVEKHEMYIGSRSVEASLDGYVAPPQDVAASIMRSRVGATYAEVLLEDFEIAGLKIVEK